VADPDDVRLKTEIDEISAKIAATLQKIEQIVPLKEEEIQSKDSDNPADSNS